MSEKVHTDLVVGLVRRLASCHRMTKLMSHRRRIEKKSVLCSFLRALLYDILLNMVSTLTLRAYNEDQGQMLGQPRSS